MISAGVFSLLALIDYCVFGPFFGSRLSFRYLDRNLGRFSKFYDLVIPINLALIFITKDNMKKVLFTLALLLSIITILLMQMRGSYVVIFLAILAIAFVYRKKLFIFILIIPFFIAIMMPSNMATRAQEMFKFGGYLKSDGVLNYRTEAWKGAVRIIKERPVLGLGVGKSNFGRTVKKFDDLKIPYDHAHNTILQIAVELGLIGLAAFLWLFGSVFFHGVKRYSSLPKTDERSVLIFGILCGIGALFAHGFIAYFYKHESFYMLWVTVALLFAMVIGLMMIAVIAAPMLFYHSNGFTQYNAQRYTLDWLPILFVMLAFALRAPEVRPNVPNGLVAALKVLVTYAVALNVMTMAMLALTT